MTGSYAMVWEMACGHGDLLCMIAVRGRMLAVRSGRPGSGGVWRSGEYLDEAAADTEAVRRTGDLTETGWSLVVGPVVFEVVGDWLADAESAARAYRTTPT